MANWEAKLSPVHRKPVLEFIAINATIVGQFGLNVKQ